MQINIFNRTKCIEYVKEETGIIFLSEAIFLLKLVHEVSSYNSAYRLSKEERNWKKRHWRRRLENEILSSLEVFAKIYVFWSDYPCWRWEIFLSGCRHIVLKVMGVNLLKPPCWQPDAVRIMGKIQTEGKYSPDKMSGGNDLAYYTYLKDVRYQ